MIVLQVCAFAAPNGGNFIAALTHLENCLKEKEIETIYAFSDGAEGKPWCTEIQKRTKVYFLPTAKARILPKTYKIFRQIYKENQISIVHSHFELYDIPSTVTAPQKTKIFWHLHDPIKYSKSKRLSRRILTKLQYSLFNSRANLLSVSIEHAEYVAAMGFNPKRIFYIPNGIDTSRILPAFKENKDNHFLMFGWEVIRKGVDLIVAADSDGQLLSECRILIIGQGACREYLREHPTEHVVFGEPVSDINSLYKESKAFIHISRAEGLSYALLEAIYAGLPVICSNIPENQIAQEFSGIFWVSNECADDIKKQIKNICYLKSPLSKMEYFKNKEIIEQKYSLFSWTKRIIEMYMSGE